MKKRLLLPMMGILLLFLLSACQGSRSLQGKISDALGVDVSSGTIGTSSDSYGGFHGDGQLFVSIHFSDGHIAEALSENRAWRSLPLSGTLTALVYGIRTEDSQTGPYLKDSGGAALFPEIRHGYYYFIDRQAEQGGDSHNDSGVLDRYSLNFTIAVYDTDTNIMYYAELDT